MSKTKRLHNIHIVNSWDIQNNGKKRLLTLEEFNLLPEKAEVIDFLGKRLKKGLDIFDLETRICFTRLKYALP